MTDHTHDTAKTVMDGLSVVTVVGTLVEMLPSVAALFTIIWTGIRIWETDTVQRIIGRKEPEDAESQSSSTQSDGDGRS
jgi:hypothetical protein